jgi:hypothetical protein
VVCYKKEVWERWRAAGIGVGEEEEEESVLHWRFGADLTGISLRPNAVQPSPPVGAWPHLVAVSCDGCVLLDTLDDSP